MYSREELEAMDEMDLISYANLNYGLGVNKEMPKYELVNLLDRTQRKFKGNENVRVLRRGEEYTCRPGEVRIRCRPGKHDKVPRPIIVGHQFKIASIPINVDVIIPAKYLTCLQDAVQDTYFQDPETRELIRQEEYTYDFTILERG